MFASQARDAGGDIDDRVPEVRYEEPKDRGAWMLARIFTHCGLEADGELVRTRRTTRRKQQFRGLTLNIIRNWLSAATF